MSAEQPAWSFFRNGQKISLRFPPTLIAGIVNVTPDSFSDGGRYFDQAAALVQAHELTRQGAHILDLGGESTRPGSLPVGCEKEQRRILPLLAVLLEERESGRAATPPGLTGLPFAGPLISLDTWRADTAAKAVQLGCDIINDVSGGTFDPAMDEIVGHYRPGYVLCHSPERPEIMQDNPEYNDVVEDVYAFFATRMEALVKAGLSVECIVLDPGIGFGKTLQHNIDLLRGLERFRALGRPLYVGLSRKGMFKQLFDLPRGEARDHATGVMSALLRERNVDIIRVHEVAGTMQALRLAELMTAPVGSPV